MHHLYLGKLTIRIDLADNEGFTTETFESGVLCFKSPVTSSEHSPAKLPHEKIKCSPSTGQSCGGMNGACDLIMAIEQQRIMTARIADFMFCLIFLLRLDR